MEDWRATVLRFNRFPRGAHATGRRRTACTRCPGATMGACELRAAWYEGRHWPRWDWSCWQVAAADRRRTTARTAAVAPRRPPDTRRTSPAWARSCAPVSRGTHGRSWPCTERAPMRPTRRWPCTPRPEGVGTYRDLARPQRQEGLDHRSPRGRPAQPGRVFGLSDAAACCPTRARSCRTPTRRPSPARVLGEEDPARLRPRHRDRLQPRQGHHTPGPDPAAGEEEGRRHLAPPGPR